MPPRLFRRRPFPLANRPVATTFALLCVASAALGFAAPRPECPAMIAAASLPLRLRGFAARSLFRAPAPPFGYSFVRTPVHCLRAGATTLADTASYPNLARATFGGMSHVAAAAPSTVGERIYRTIFILGGPGAGKGTQCDRILDHYPGAGSYVCHLSVGDLLRAARASGGEDAELIERTIVAGKIVPVEVSLGLLKKAMDTVCDEAASPPIFLVDGFPRNDDNLDGWLAIMGSHSALLGTIVYDCPVEELERRILERAKTSGRSDDNIASLRQRFATFEADTSPVVGRLEDERRCPVLRVDAGRSAADVWDVTRAEMDGVVGSDVLAANAALLDCAGRGDWVGYAALCAPDMAEEAGVAALETDVTHSNEIADARIDLAGKTAVVEYVRTMRAADGGKVVGEVRETRVWSYSEGKGEEGRVGWTNVHFVRLPL